MSQIAVTPLPGTHHPAQSHDTLAHPVTAWVLLATWLTLLFFTVVTVAATYIDLGGFNIWLALLIATVKASLVALYFMHLRYDNPFYAVILIVALLFVVLFIGIALTDTGAYQPDFQPPQGIPGRP